MRTQTALMTGGMNRRKTCHDSKIASIVIEYGH